jgi:hypothetical protein
MKAIKPLIFAALAGLPLIIGPAMAQNAPVVRGNGYPSNSASDSNTAPTTDQKGLSEKGLSAPHVPVQGGVNGASQSGG